MAEPWHVKKEVSISHMISTLILLLALVAAWDDLGDRVDVLEIRSDQLEKTDNMQSIRVDKLQLSIDTKLNQLDVKMDRLKDLLIEHSEHRSRG